tara:strand:+ start:2176 stop:2727 length:552 start_codon:yes stop_codon:yes gene_type:complete
MEDYDLRVAKMISKHFSQNTGLDLKSISKTPRNTYLRSLLYKLLKDNNSMKDRMISHYFENYVGIKRNRSAIFTSLSKINLYYTNYSEFRNYYDVFFKDKIKGRIKKELKTREFLASRKLKKTEPNDNVSFNKFNRESLNEVISKLPEDKVKEIRDLVNLRIKSWDWKSNDNCQVIECSGIKL